MIRIAILLLAVLFALPAAAQTFPAKPLRVIVVYPPGGTSDAVARLLAEKLAPTLGQQVVVENRGGAGGAIGMDAMAKSAPTATPSPLARSARSRCCRTWARCLTTR